MEFNPTTPESSSTEDDDDAKKKKKVTGAAALLSQKETVKPENDKRTQEVAQAVEKLIWRREEEPETEKPQRHEEVKGLSDDEAKEVAIDHVAERQDEVKEELQYAEPGTRDAAEAAADAVLLDHDEEQLNSTATFEEALRKALQEAELTLATERAQAQTFTAEVPEETQPPAEEAMPEQPSNTYVPPATPPRVSMMAPPPQYERGTMLPPLESAPSTPEPEVPQPAPKRGFFSFLRRRSSSGSAERRFTAQQEVLVREVQDVHRKITDQESYIRDVAGKSFEAQREAAQATQPEVSQQASRETVEGQQTMPLPEKPATGERPVNVPEYKTAQMLTHEELLKVSEKIIIEGASLRSIYESKRITEKGLRRLVNEYYHGGNMRRQLAKEMVEKEREFEIDPLLREHFAGGGLEGGGVHPAQGVPQAAPNSEPSTQPARTDEKKPSLRTPSLPEVVTSPQSLAITAWVVFIVILAVIAAILLLSR